MGMVRSPKSISGAVGLALGNAPYKIGDRTDELNAPESPPVVKRKRINTFSLQYYYAQPNLRGDAKQSKRN